MACHLASAWLLQNGAGSITEPKKQELRGILLEDFDRLLGLPGPRPAAVEEEIQLFLASGRASESNFGRLQRRVETRLAGSSRSESNYSHITETSLRPSGCVSARESSSRAFREAAPALPALATRCCGSFSPLIAGEAGSCRQPSRVSLFMGEGLSRGKP
ncbi:unnamed protein product [Symbiodinium necroappetens]|uniref:Uncharacterized protein n=1 Tax=Symbiodinium necroappetens TaxID=1628268 RepID=A0A812WNT3_9DINO|nr:unnamed protein product [Symbiodinium necroappetens]